MRGSIHLLVTFMLLFPSLAVAEDLGLARLSLIQGNVQILSQDNGEWSPATINMPLFEGDRLWAPENSKLEIQVSGRFYLRVDEQSSVDLLSLKSDAVQLYIDHGHIYLNNRRGGVETVQVDTPLSSIRTYDNAIMLLDVEEDNTIDVQSLQGYVYVENREGKTRIASGSALTIRPDGTAELAPIGTPDEWETWNRDLDMQRMAGGESSRYLPDALQDFASDLDQNGRWVYVSEYGYVWNPASISAGWAPYREGYWRWIQGQYVWISDEPWGWAPYHYGRWAFVNGFGWCWVPPTADDVYWGPGYVSWVDSPDYVGWIPLAPGDIYYGYGYYGPGSINITTINVQTIVVLPPRNAKIHNSITLLKRDTFGTPRPLPLMFRDNPFLKHRDEFLPPAVKPKQPAHIKPRIVEPGRKQPPERIQRIRPAEIKVERKLMKQRESSVFKPNSRKPLVLKQMKEPKVINRHIKPPVRVEKNEKSHTLNERK
jgi:Family of unknown function (DUF6600)/FecR protein